MPSRSANDQSDSRTPWRLKIRSLAGLRAAGSRHESWANARAYRRQLLLERLHDRLVFASLAGLVFEDANQSWRQDSGEVGVDKQVVYVDLNGNGQLDDSEPLTLTDSNGAFQFDDLSGDSAIVRLFNGRSGSPAPFFPVTPTIAQPSLNFTGGSSMQLMPDGRVLSIAGSSLIDGSLASSQTTSYAFDGPVKAAQLLADGRILVLSDDDQGNHAFIVDTDGQSKAIALGTNAPADGWSSLVVDPSGNGVLLEQSSEATSIRGIVIGDSIQVGTSNISVGSNSRLTGGGELTTVISTPIDGGLKLRLWSNATGTEVSNAGGIDVTGASQVISYSDSNGLVLVRNTANSYSVLDAAAGFASLQTIQSDGVVTLDASRDLLYTLNNVGILKIIDVNSAKAVGTFLLPPQLASGAVQVQFDSEQSRLLILNSSGVQTVTFQPAFQQVVPLTGPAAGGQITFAIPHAPINTPPKLSSSPLLQLPEDSVLNSSRSQWLANASDSDNDQFISLLGTAPSHGTATIRPNGSLTYVPDLNFFGSDSFSIVLHDGMTASTPITVDVNVLPVNDELVVSIQANAVPENTAPGFVAASLQVTNVDGGTINWSTNDSRFVVKNDQVVIAPSASFDFETEPQVPLTITAAESNSSEVVKVSLDIAISDVYESIKEIRPNTASVKENIEGDLIAELSVVDDGNEAAYLFTVDDDRFEVAFRDLRLKAGVSLDYEAEPTVTVLVTALSSNGESRTEPLVITVIDVPEAIGTVELARREILELVRGAEVGGVLVNGNGLTSNYVATVDDSRFEVVGGKLRLRSNEYLRRADQQEVQLTVTVTDSSGQFPPVSEPFLIEVLTNSNPFHNPSNPYDVNNDGQVSPLDALVIINAISQHGGPGAISGFPSPTKYYDVNGDGLITALDALLIINYLNRRPTGTSEGEQVVQNSQPSFGTAENNRFASNDQADNSDSATPNLQPQTNSKPQNPVAAPLILAPLNPLSGTAMADAPVDISMGASTLVGSEDSNSADLRKLRDLVVDMLADDHSSSNDEIEAALNDFVTDDLIDPL